MCRECVCCVCCAGNVNGTVIIYLFVYKMPLDRWEIARKSWAKAPRETGRWYGVNDLTGDLWICGPVESANVRMFVLLKTETFKTFHRIWPTTILFRQRSTKKDRQIDMEETIPLETEMTFNLWSFKVHYSIADEFFVYSFHAWTN